MGGRFGGSAALGGGERKRNVANVIRGGGGGVGEKRERTWLAIGVIRHSIRPAVGSCSKLPPHVLCVY